MEAKLIVERLGEPREAFITDYQILSVSGKSVAVRSHVSCTLLKVLKTEQGCTHLVHELVATHWCSYITRVWPALCVLVQTQDKLPLTIRFCTTVSVVLMFVLHHYCYCCCGCLVA